MTMAKKHIRKKQVVKKSAKRKTVKKIKRGQPLEPLCRLRLKMEQQYGEKKGRKLFEECLKDAVSKIFGFTSQNIEGKE